MRDAKLIRLSRSIVGSSEVKALSDVILHDGYLGMGRYVRDFEAELKRYLGVKYAVCVNSGTAALHMALMAAGLKKGDEVLVQSLTYVACFQAISATGAIPVACEVVPGSCTIDLKDARKRLTRRTKAIMPVHYASRPGEFDEILKFAGSNGLRVVEDAAHAFGGIYKGKKIGSFGDITCFSFDGIKNITCGEGGVVVTNDKKAAEFVMDTRLLAIKNDTGKRYKGLRSWSFDVEHQGYRYHMSNLFAAIGLAQFKRLEGEFKPKRQRLAKIYHKALKGVRGIILFPDNYDEIIPHIFPIRVLAGRRNSLKRHLALNNIESGIHYYPNHLLTYFGAGSLKLPVTEKIYGELLSLPLHPGLSGQQQDKVINCVVDFLKTER